MDGNAMKKSISYNFLEWFHSLVCIFIFLSLYLFFVTIVVQGDAALGEILGTICL
jgi:hypothetical protein